MMNMVQVEKDVLFLFALIAALTVMFLGKGYATDADIAELRREVQGVHALTMGVFCFRAQDHAPEAKGTDEVCEHAERLMKEALNAP